MDTNQIILIALAAIVMAYGCGMVHGAWLALKPDKEKKPEPKRFKTSEEWDYREVSGRN